MLILFVLGFSDEVETARPHLLRIKKKFLDSHIQNVKDNNSTLKNEELNSILDEIQHNFSAKISIVGLSGVGKTTTTQLIKAEKIKSTPESTIWKINNEINLI